MGDDLTHKDKGKIVGPIHSQYGYHILMITDVERNQILDEQTVPLISSSDLQRKIDSKEPVTILDIRESWEQDIAHIEEARFITRDNCEDILNALDKNLEIILVDWKGERLSSFRGWLLQRGFSQVKGLQGGIDAWSMETDNGLNRYDIDEDDGYRYEDVLPEN